MGLQANPSAAAARGAETIPGGLPVGEDHDASLPTAHSVLGGP